MLNVSERKVCSVLGQHRSTQRRLPKGREDEDRLVADMIELTRQYGRYGYRRVSETEKMKLASQSNEKLS
jgi:putative transposase